MEFLANWGLFAVKLVTVLVFVFLLVSLLISLAMQAKAHNEDDKDKIKFKFTNLFNFYKDNVDKLDAAIDEFDESKSDKEKKAYLKQKAKALKTAPEKLREEKAERIKKAEEQGEFCPEHLYVIDFDGDARASQVDELTSKVNLILAKATDKDEVIIKLTSPGGVVNGYGLCASQLERIRNKGINLVACVDTVAASGGYMMACVASKIVAAPFSYVGSIGVVAQIPNFNKVLKNHDVEYEQVTAGKYKRTLTMFGENTPEARDKFKQEITLIHNRFKAIVAKYRTKLDIENIATGEYWLAEDAKELNLVDQISTFDEYLQNRLDFTKVCAIKISIDKDEKKSLKDILKKLLMAKTWIKTVRKQLTKAVECDNQYQIK
ncbi:MAG: protease SohB [Succinivibrio sp.]|nr:protease SohB [Succinivibrio sp.]MBQ8476886.1 protease SohB [Succinivibrio sp.]MCI5637774.1 protease SohB [Succinivibrio sp.]MCI7773769.1 protease SohB [Succinivibrio sp.]MDD6067502.1 protease SohB [Succinivibrio sp.]